MKIQKGGMKGRCKHIDIDFRFGLCRHLGVCWVLYVLPHSRAGLPYASPWYSHGCSDCISSLRLCTLVYVYFFESPKFCAVSQESQKFFLVLQRQIKSNYFSPTLQVAGTLVCVYKLHIDRRKTGKYVPVESEEQDGS